MNRYPLIVVGGGPAGFCAAVAAARMGVRTLLVEQYGILGGAMTVGCVPYPMNFATEDRQVISGVGWELMERLMEAGWAQGKGRKPYRPVEVDSVMTACEMDVMIREAGAELLLNCKLCEAETKMGRIESALFAAPEGLIRLEADLWIDATGDGQLSALAGAAFEIGEATTGEVQPGTLGFWMDGYKRENLNGENVTRSFWTARREGRLLPGDYYGETAWGMDEMFRRHGFNVNHVEIGNVTATDRTRAALEGRSRIRRIMNWAKHECSGMEYIYTARRLHQRRGRVNPAVSSEKVT